MSKQKLLICENQNILKAYLDEKLDESQELEIREHLDSCENCQTSLEQLAAGQSMWDEVHDLSSTRFLDDTGRDKANDSASQIKGLVDFLAPTDDPEMLGKLGAYEVVGLVGQGSTGMVLKAFEPRLNRFVAIKLLSPTYSSNGAARQRFEREARAVAAILHQNVVPIYSVDEFRGVPYIVMQYVAGLSLLQRIEKNGPLNSCEIVRLGLQIAEGLRAAHECGIVHRDVKPANVMLENSVDRAMVTDFGLAQVADETSMTRSGTIAGTPQYMSPEQARGEAIDARSDLFSLGSLLYAACTGRPPFRAETVFGVINRVCDSTPRPIREINPKIEEWLTSFIERLLSKNREERFQDCDEVIRVLSGELAYMQNPTAAQKPSRNWIPQTVAPKKEHQKKSSTASKLFWAIGLSLTFIGGAIIADKLLNGGEFSKFAMAIFVPSQQEEELEFGKPRITWKRGTVDDNSTDKGTYERTFEQIFEFESGGNLDIEIPFGDVVVIPSELDDRVTVMMITKVEASSRAEAEKILKDHAVELVNEEEKFKIQAAFSDPKSRFRKKFKRMVYRISVPTETNATVKSAEGDLNFGGLVGNINATAKNGCIDFEFIDGDIWAEATSGCINISEGCSGEAEALAIHGDVLAANIQTKGYFRTSGGDVRLGKSKGKVASQVSGGDIRVNGIEGKVSVHAEHGNVLVNVLDTPPANCSASSQDGEISLRIAEDINMDLRVHGEVDSALNFEPDSDEEDDVLWSAHKLNLGGNVLTASSSGMVNIKLIDSTKAESLGGSGLGGSGGSTHTSQISDLARQKTTGEPRPGAIATIELANETNIDGYTLYLPVTYDKEKGPYPVLVYLQGSFGVGGHVGGINNWGLPRLIRDQNDLTTERNQLLLDSFIVVSPHIKQGQYHSQPKMVTEILSDVISEYNGDSAKVYLTGLSRGGHGTWGLATALPDTFAAIVPIAGSPDEITSYESLKGPSIWVAHNTGDSGIANVKKAVKRIESVTGKEFMRIAQSSPTDPEYVNQKYIFTSPNMDGHDAWTDMYCSTELYKWLLNQKK